MLQRTLDTATSGPDMHQHWAQLFQHQIRNVGSWASDAFLVGLQRVGFRPGVMPDITSLNRGLNIATGWQTELMPARPEPRTMLHALAERVMPVRADFGQHATPAPVPNGFFEDVFGFVPMLTHPGYANFVATAAQAALGHESATGSGPLVQCLQYVMENGVIREGNESRAFGARLLAGCNGPRPLEDGILIPLDADAWREMAELDPHGPQYLPLIERWEDLPRFWQTLLENERPALYRKAA